MKTGNWVALGKYESRFYFIAWSCAIVYSAYQLYLSSKYFDYYHDAYADFDSGWKWIGRRRDISDHEWRIWLPLIGTLIPFTFIHHLVSQIIKVDCNSTVLCYWYILTSLAFLYYYVGALGALCALIQPSLLHVLTSTCSKSVAWLIHISFLFIIHVLKIPDGSFQNWLGFTDEQHYILTLTMCWIELRSISHNMDSFDNTVYGSDGFIQRLAYCLYLPTLCLGPLILYHEFTKSIAQSHQYWNFEKLQVFTLNLIRYAFWLYLTELLLHFIYLNAIQYQPQIVQNLNPWALYGLGYCMGQFFLNKYVVIYGTCSNLCYLDDIKAPPRPKCIARIHLYSDMWKYFDNGLYKFLLRYIYIPIQQTDILYYKKLFASFLCFAFILIWHGIQMTIFIWALLNFIGVTIEDIGKLIGRSKKYRNIQDTYLSLEASRRLHCILTSPLLAMSAISNFYFFAGQEIGDIFIQNILHGSWKILFILFSFLYCCCQVSIDVKNWELRCIKD